MSRLFNSSGSSVIHREGCFLDVSLSPSIRVGDVICLRYNEYKEIVSLRPQPTQNSSLYRPLNMGSVISALGRGIGTIFATLGRGIGRIITSIAHVFVTIVQAITAVIITIYDVLSDIVCCRYCGSRRSKMRSGKRRDFPSKLRRDGTSNGQEGTPNRQEGTSKREESTSTF
ncbi:hypothetical protein ARMSODRAFT_799121 [Armillaria solidipes]|uniref:Uncharacterized protein n=1 Tax=Armillaria solidipes TaxID=1076256 RepID=A0A2H3AP58_9AGAR|nr:hypothetical protein ARMSODRAFT_799121 [Armillaria solidipes]